jgi:hypothetical protein
MAPYKVFVFNKSKKEKVKKLFKGSVFAKFSAAGR